MVIALPRILTPPRPGEERNIRIVSVNVRTTYDDWLKFRSACLKQGLGVSVAIGRIAAKSVNDPEAIAKLLR